MLDALIALHHNLGLKGRTQLRRVKPRIVVKTADGIPFSVSTGNPMDSAVIKTGYFEREVLDAILEHLPTKGVLWDVGANGGLHAITVERLRPQAFVVAFEPVPSTLRLLRENITLARSRIHVSTYALSDRDGTAPMAVMEEGNTGLSSLTPWAEVTYSRTVEVTTRRGDNQALRDEYPAPNVLKIDVEGHELPVLRGFGSTLSDATLAAVIYEAPEGSPAGSGEVATVLRSFGFTRFSALPSTERAAPSNYLATR